MSIQNFDLLRKKGEIPEGIKRAGITNLLWSKKVLDKYIEEDSKKEYASKGVAGTALGLGIAGTALWLLGGNARGLFGNCGCNNITFWFKDEDAKEGKVWDYFND